LELEAEPKFIIYLVESVSQGCNFATKSGGDNGEETRKAHRLQLKVCRVRSWGGAASPPSHHL